MANPLAWLQGLWHRIAGERGRVLVIDPNSDAVELLRTHLKDTPVRLDAVSFPGDAFEYIRRNAAEPPHLFIISYRQGGETTGLETGRLLGQIRTVSRTPILIVHERMPEERVVEYRKVLPRAEFIERPYTGKNMQDIVMTLVKRGQHRPAARTSVTGQAEIPPPPRIRPR